MKKYIIAIDQGTSSSRAVLFDKAGEIISSSQKELKMIYQQSDYVEQDADDIWSSVLSTIAECIATAEILPEEINSIGITNQRETTVVWNRFTGKPYYPAIVWQDTRTDKICSQLIEAGGQDRFRKITGLPLSTYFSGPKITWLLENIDGLRGDAEAGKAIFRNIDTWLLWNLTGGREGGLHLTDVTNASRTLLMDLHTLDWDEEMLSVLGIPRLMLPEIVSSSNGKPSTVSRPSVFCMIISSLSVSSNVFALSLCDLRYPS